MKEFIKKHSQISYRFCKLLVVKVWQKRLLETAQSLTFVSLLSLVPIFAIFFSILGAISHRPGMRQELQSYMSANFIPQYGEVVFQYLERFSQTTLTTGTFGILTFFLVGILFYARIDNVLNEIWEVQSQRHWLEKIGGFFVLLIVAPLIIVISFSITPFLSQLPVKSGIFDSIQTYFVSFVVPLFSFFIPVLFASFLLFLMYIYFPMAFVMKRAALVGAFIAAILLQLSYLGLNIYFLEMIGYEKVYGSLAVFPILILWIFIVWLIILIGAVITYVWQTYRANGYNEFAVYDLESIGISATRIFLFVCQKYYQQKQWASVEDMQLQLSLSAQRVRFILNEMKKSGFVVEFTPFDINQKYSVAYQPAIPPSEVTCDTFFRLFRKKRVFKVSEPIYWIMEPIRTLQHDLFKKVTFDDVVREPHNALPYMSSYLLKLVNTLKKENAPSYKLSKP